MTFGAPDSATTHSMRIPSIVILGADALLAALPATPIQLAHACALVGYQHVIPASWGDELIAAASLRVLRDHAPTPAIQCSCPYVAHRLLAVGTDLRPFLISLVAPPVMLARYLRAMYEPRKLRITYVGRCPGAADESVDARLTPEELLATFADHHVVLDEQPDAFDSVIPPDRRRFRSQPGGLPTAEMLWRSNADAGGGTAGNVAWSLVELYGDELPVELAQHLLGGKPVLIDVAPKLGCVCSGASAHAAPAEARARVTALEPPRATTPVVDERVAMDAMLPLPASPRSVIDVVSPPAPPSGGPAAGQALPNDSRREELIDDTAASRPAWSDTAASTHGTAGARRHSPTRGIARPVAGNLPTARDADGRQLPRTYVARRRPPMRGSRLPTPEVEAPIASTAGDNAESSSDMPDKSMKASAAEQLPSYGGGAASEVNPPTQQPSTAFVSAAPIPATESIEHAATRRTAASPAAEPATEAAPRYAERAVALPVTRLSDGRRRDESSVDRATDRTVMQLLTLGLLISMIVLVSAAVGVLVGRWMSQH
jgi:Iron only hydrogenase large subunit, C-terminal domain